MSNTLTLISQSNPTISATLVSQNNGNLLYTYIDAASQTYQSCNIGFCPLLPFITAQSSVTPIAPPTGSTIGTFTLGSVTLSYDTTLLCASALQSGLKTLLASVQVGPVPVFITKEQYGTLTLNADGLSYQIAAGHDHQYGTPKQQWSVSLSDLKGASIAVSDKTFSVNDHQHYRFSTRLFPCAPAASDSANESTATQAMTALLQCFIDAVKDLYATTNIVVLNNTTSDTVTFNQVQEQSVGALPFVNALSELTTIDAGNTCIVVAASASDYVLTQSDGSPLWYFSSGSGNACLVDISSNMSSVLSASGNVLQQIMAYPSSTLGQGFTQYNKSLPSNEWVLYQFEQLLAAQTGDFAGVLLPQILLLQGYQSAILQAWDGTYYIYSGSDYLDKLEISGNNEVSYNGERLTDVTFTAASAGQMALLSGTAKQGSTELNFNLNFFWYPGSSDIGTKSITKACSGTVISGKTTSKIVGYADKVVSGGSSSSTNYVDWALTIGGLLAYLYELYKWFNGQSASEPDTKDLAKLEQEGADLRGQIDTDALDESANADLANLEAQSSALQQQNENGYDVSEQLNEMKNDMNNINNEVLPKAPEDASDFNHDVAQLNGLSQDAEKAEEAAEQGIEAEYKSDSSIYKQAQSLQAQAEAESKAIEQETVADEDEIDGDDGDDGGVDAETVV